MTGSADRLCRLPQKAKRQDEGQRQCQKLGIGPGMSGLSKRGPSAGGIGLAVFGLLATRAVLQRDGHLPGQIPALDISANLDGDQPR